MNLGDKKIAVIGLGYVGLPLAVEFGKKRPVIGFDIKSTRIEELRAGCDRALKVNTVRALQSFNADVDVYDPWIDPNDAMDEYGLSASSHPPASGQYDAIVLAVAHRQFLEWGVERIRAFGKPQHVLYDVKAVLPRAASDGRL